MRHCKKNDESQMSKFIEITIACNFIIHRQLVLQTPDISLWPVERSEPDNCK